MVSNAAIRSRSTRTATPSWSTVRRMSFCTLSSADSVSSRLKLIVTGRGVRCNPCMPLTGMPRLAQGPLKQREDCSPADNS